MHRGWHCTVHYTSSCLSAPAAHCFFILHSALYRVWHPFADFNTTKKAHELNDIRQIWPIIGSFWTMLISTILPSCAIWRNAHQHVAQINYCIIEDTNDYFSNTVVNAVVEYQRWPKCLPLTPQIVVGQLSGEDPLWHWSLTRSTRLHWKNQEGLSPPFQLHRLHCSPALDKTLKPLPGDRLRSSLGITGNNPNVAAASVLLFGAICHSHVGEVMLMWVLVHLLDATCDCFLWQTFWC